MNYLDKVFSKPSNKQINGDDVILQYIINCAKNNDVLLDRVKYTDKTNLILQSRF